MLNSHGRHTHTCELKRRVPTRGFSFSTSYSLEEVIVGIEEQRVYYNHEPGCDDDDLGQPNARGLRTCNNCAGVFDAEGKGVAVTSKKFD